MSARRLHRSTAVLLGVLVIAGCSTNPIPHPTGEPDPGHRRLTALEQLRSAVPASAHVSSSDSVESRWDSCDGRLSTFGWDDVTVDSTFDTTDSSAAVVHHIDAMLRSHGIEPDRPRIGHGQWFWTGTTADGYTVDVQLLGPDAGSDQSEWEFQLTTPPATHPVSGC